MRAISQPDGATYMNRKILSINISSLQDCLKIK